MALYLREADVAKLLNMNETLAALEAAHRSHALGKAIDIPRARTRTPSAMLHIMHGALIEEGIIGYKAYTTSGSGVRFLVHLFDADGALLAVIESNLLGMMRTGAAGALSAKFLARPESTSIGLIGAGWQAQGQIAALKRVFPLEVVRVYSRDTARLNGFCKVASSKLNIKVVPANSASVCVHAADIVITVTSSPTPVLVAEDVNPGTHIIAAGSNSLSRQELDEALVRRAQVICVDSKASALAEAGDLLPLIEKGHTHPGAWVELGEVIASTREGRKTPKDITLFESQGMAIQDLAVAYQIFKKAQEKSIGTALPF